MNKIIYIIFLFIFSALQSQDINITVRDISKKYAENINVQLIKNGKIIDFKKTDNLGQCNFRLSEKGVFLIKLTSLFFETKSLEVDTNEKLNFEIILDSQIKDIQEVEIKSRPKIARAKEDTISFNVMAVRDGTERTTEDLIRKLPGLDISENGKVTFKGNPIGQVLVEGNEFFGKNHKISTQNISSDMIEGIDLWQNYTTINENRSTALNLKLKEKYKGKITGNIEGNYGINNSYLGHANLFKFEKFGNLAFIGDANNLAIDPISYMDFYEMNSQENIDNANSTLNIDIPSFLNNDNRVKSKNNQFGALQYSKSGKNFSITAFSILNNAQLSKFSINKRTGFPGQPAIFNFLEHNFEDNSGFFGTTQIKFKTKFKDNSFLYYNFGYNPTIDNFKQNINRSSIELQLLDIDNVSRNNSLSNFISWNKQIGSSKIILSFSQINESSKTNLEISSNNDLFFRNTNYLIQNYNINSDRYAFDFNLKNKNKIINVNFKSGFNYKKDTSVLEEFLLQEKENIVLKTYHFINDINANKKIGKFEFYSSISSNLIQINNSNNHYFEKMFRIKYTPESKVSTDFVIEYNSKYAIPNLRLLQNNPLYLKDMSYFQNTALTPNSLSRTDNYKFMWNRFNMDKGNLIFLILSYEKSKPNYTSNLTNFGTFSLIQNTIGTFKERYLSIISSDYKISKYLILKSKFSGLLNKDSNFIDGNHNLTTVQNFEISQKLSTNFKNSLLQFDIGYILSKGIFEQSFYKTSSNQDNIKFSLGIRGNINKNLLFSTIGDYLIQKTEQNNLENFLIGGHFSYRKEKSNWEYNLRFNNILNLKSFSYINSYTSQLGTDESTTTALQGYIIGGLKIYF